MASIVEAGTAKLTLLKQLVWGSQTLPTTLAAAIETGWNGANGVTGLASTDRWTITDTTGQSKYAWLMHPSAAWNNKLVIMHSGHVGDDVRDAGTKSINMLEDLLAAGYRVLGMSMPGVDMTGAETSYNVTIGGTSYAVAADHNVLKPCAGAGMLKIFVEPVIIAINQARTLYADVPIFMTGISGGGWTTTFCAALDTRISRSYPVSGCLPHDWFGVVGGNGDWELWRGAPWFRLTGLDYDELWALAVNSGSRRQRVCFNDQDPEYSVGELPAHYFTCLQATLAQIGTWNRTINTGTDRDTHSYSATIRTAILDDMAA